MKHLKLFESENRELDMVFIQYSDNLGELDAMTIYIDGELFFHRVDDFYLEVYQGINMTLKYLNIPCKKESIIIRDKKMISEIGCGKQPPKYLDSLLMSTDNWERVTKK